MKKEMVILGGGAAGYSCALQAARQGAKPILVERDALGGTCFRWGCLPVKYMMDRIRAMKTRHGYWNGGIEGKQSISREEASIILKDCRATMEAVSGRMAETLRLAGVEILMGEAELTGPDTLHIGDRKISFDRLVIATGTEAAAPANLVPDGKRLITHREAVLLETPPDTLIIIGGDVEGLEFASLFSELGTSVTVLEMLPSLLGGMDDDLTDPLFERLKLNGVNLVPGTRVASAEAMENGIRVTASDGRIYEAEYALVTMTRRPVVPKGLETTGMKLTTDRLTVDDHCCTAVSGIYCIGDLNGRMEMAHTAIQQGFLLADHLIKGSPVTWQYGPLPRAMFTLPQNGGAGYQEKELQAQGIRYRKSKVKWESTWRGAGQSSPDGFLKVLVGETGELLGIWLVGDEISEQVNLMGVLVGQGATIQSVKHQLWVHPTCSEALLQAVLELN
jgi:dihydrolipoamide dehydrogenase